MECFVCKEIKCELTMVLGGETGFVLSIPSNHPQLHAVIELSQLNPSVETFSPPQAATGDTSTNGAANPTTCGVTVEAASVLRPGKGCPADSTRYIGGRKRDNYQGKRLSCCF